MGRPLEAIFSMFARTALTTQNRTQYQQVAELQELEEGECKPQMLPEEKGVRWVWVG